MVICGTTLNSNLECFKSQFNAADDDYKSGVPCDQYLTAKMDATKFVNMRGFNNLTTYNCTILNPYQETGLIFDNSTQKIALGLWSIESANNTAINITKDEWFLYGTFTEKSIIKFIGY
ncbi:hypothetical protein C1645_742126 [Glomus cerebriforme]|uniref:Uncharacterized protein n=1 Tax=Glomus cerebriforme TaxID=658196 RepID=A0A397SIK3_9GLOM|nr:hypothetical protein C1645_742126 [Glomus cerebriforme]